MPAGKPCPFPEDDGYPESYISKRRGHLSNAFLKPSIGSLELQFNDFRDDSTRTLHFTHKPLGLHWIEGQMPITVSAVATGSPADQAGVMKGWFLLNAAGENLLIHKYEEAVSILQRYVSKLPDANSDYMPSQH